MKLGAWLRTVAISLLLAVLALAAITARAVLDGEEQMRQSDKAFDHGDLRDATDHARRAAVLYAPGAPHVQAAYDRLIAIAVGAESAGQHELAEAAWRAVRGAALETRHIWIPRGRELARANENLARLSAVPQKHDPGPLPSDPAAAIERTRRDLERDHAPSAPWIGVLAAGFLLAVGGLGWAAHSAVSPDGRFALKQARWALLVTLVGAACWTLAVLQA